MQYVVNGVFVVVIIVVVVFTLNHNHSFYPTTSAVHPVSVLIFHPRYKIMRSQTAVRQRITKVARAQHANQEISAKKY